MSRKSIRQSTVGRLNKGEEITLAGSYTAVWNGESQEMRVFYEKPDRPKKLVCIVKVELDEDNTPVFDWTRWHIDSQPTKKRVIDLVNAIYGIVGESEAEEVRVAGLVAIPEDKIMGLIGFTIFDEEIKGILTEQTEDGKKYWVRTQNGIKTLKEVFKTTKLIIKE